MDYLLKPIEFDRFSKAVLEKLPAPEFQRIHRSFIVPVARVMSIQNRKVKLNSQVELPISDSYTSFINTWIKK